MDTIFYYWWIEAIVLQYLNQNPFIKARILDEEHYSHTTSRLPTREVGLGIRDFPLNCPWPIVLWVGITEMYKRILVRIIFYKNTLCVSLTLWNITKTGKCIKIYVPKYSSIHLLPATATNYQHIIPTYCIININSV